MKCRIWKIELLRVKDEDLQTNGRPEMSDCDPSIRDMDEDDVIMSVSNQQNVLYEQKMKELNKREEHLAQRERWSLT